MMIDLKEYALDIQKRLNQESNINFMLEFATFMNNNNWFDSNPTFTNGVVYIDNDVLNRYKDEIAFYFANHNKSTYDKRIIMIDRLTNDMPLTGSYFLEYLKVQKVEEDNIITLLDFMLKYLKFEVIFMSDDDVQALITLAFVEMSKKNGDYLTRFLSFVKQKYSTNYHNDYIMEARSTSDSNEAYSTNEYLQMIYYFFNEEYIINHSMYQKAANSLMYANIWLYLAMHFVCAIRDTDLIRIPHPKLPYEPEEVLEKIRFEEFSDNDSKLVLLSVVTYLNTVELKPNKTKRFNVSSIKLNFPSSVESHMGKLFALVEAHYLLNHQTKEDTDFIHPIKDYKTIKKYMGDEIGELFRESNFRNRSANKAYMQSIEYISNEMYKQDGLAINGYLMAALARSHKGSYGTFANTTMTYLKDAKFSGLTPEFVAKELLERGVLSFIPSLLLKMISGGTYDSISISNQSELVKMVSLSPLDIDNLVKVNATLMNQSVNVVKEIAAEVNNSKTAIMKFLHNLATYRAFSKNSECLCVVTAMNKLCPYMDRTSCIGCKYEVSTKSTLFLILAEFRRLEALYKNTSSDELKSKYRMIMTQVILPSLDEIITCIKEQYGDESVELIVKLMEDEMNE